MEDIRHLERTVDKIAQSYIGSNTPGMALLIGKGENILLKRAYGLADVENKKRIDVKDKFIIASVTKQFTCMAVMMLKERGLLDYEQNIEKYFPDFPEYRSKVTLRHLMAHTSGIKEYLNGADDDSLKKVEYARLEDMLEIIKSFGGLQYEPGSKFSYCNSSYIMLGKIIEKVSGLEFGEFLRKNIFLPLEMSNSSAPAYCDTPPEGLICGYAEKHGELAKQPYDMLALGWADGNIISTVDDLFKWSRALNTEKLVKRRTLLEAFTPNRLTDGTYSMYGFGWFLSDYKRHRQYSHTGGTTGFITKHARFIDDDITLIMLTNNHEINRDDIFDAVSDCILDIGQS